VITLSGFHRTIFLAFTSKVLSNNFQCWSWPIVHDKVYLLVVTLPFNQASQSAFDIIVTLPSRSSVLTVPKKVYFLWMHIHWGSFTLGEVGMYGKVSPNVTWRKWVRQSVAYNKKIEWHFCMFQKNIDTNH
jgi:hypothetical protein